LITFEAITKLPMMPPGAIGGAMSGDMYLLPTLIASLVMYKLGFNEINLGPTRPWMCWRMR